MATPLQLKIGLSGVRGVVGEALSPQLVTKFAAAFGTWCSGGPIVVAGDTRASSEMIRQAALAGLLSVGCTPLDLGTQPTPVVQHAIRRWRARGGLIATGGSQPEGWNSLRFRGADGATLPPGQAAELIDLYHQGVFPRVDAAAIAPVQTPGDAVEAYLDALLGQVDAASIWTAAVPLVIDTYGGAGREVAERLCAALGCRATFLDSPPGDEDAGPELREPLATAVRAHQAALGAGLAAGGDRLLLVAADGGILPADATLALVARAWLRRGRGPVVVNAAASRLVDDVVGAAGGEVRRCQGGEAQVCEALQAHGGAVGGEGNGGVILPTLNPGRDGFAALAVLLEAVARGEALDAPLRGLPRYAMVRRSLTVGPREVPGILRRVRQRYRDVPHDLTDGVRLVWPDRWVLARPSNSQALLRVVAEAPDEPAAAALVRELAEIVHPGG
ncbi:MAG: hypothetical protein IT204_02610 [Fimbriimonadaceae bacterium]|nr:hypothetical protein [Fimbriimonadaceae bacterium]